MPDHDLLLARPVLLESERDAVGTLGARLDGQPEREQRVQEPPLALLELEPEALGTVPRTKNKDTTIRLDNFSTGSPVDNKSLLPVLTFVPQMNDESIIQELARKLGSAFAQNRLGHAIKMLTQPKLLIIDEIGYLGLDSTQASLLFQVLCNRYERNHAVIITSNKAFCDWADVFAGDAVLASAALDRLLHRSTVLNIKAESYRLKDKRRAGILARPQPTLPVTATVGAKGKTAKEERV